MDSRLRDQEISKRFGRNLWKARRHAGFSQEELAQLTSMHRTHIGYMEQGNRLPRADNLVKLASALAVGVEELLRGIEWVVPGPSRRGSFLIDPPA